jgi:hypothetical protein
MTISQEGLKDFIELLQDLGHSKKIPPSPEFGICYFLNYADSNLRGLAKHLMTEWPKYSGNDRYPVPHPTETSLRAFMYTPNLWIGEYGDLRRELCLFLVVELTKHVVVPTTALDIIRKAMEIAQDAPELNLSNYDESQVVAINTALIDVYCLLGDFLADLPEEGLKNNLPKDVKGAVAP